MMSKSHLLSVKSLMGARDPGCRLGSSTASVCSESKRSTKSISSPKRTERTALPAFYDLQWRGMVLWESSGSKRM